MEHQAYRCCLPTLAGFAGNHCIGPGFQRRPAGCSPASPPRRGIRPSYSGLLVQGTATSPSSTTKTGADGQDRTDDLRFTKPLLYQLSYIGEIRDCHYATFTPTRKQIGTATEHMQPGAIHLRDHEVRGKGVERRTWAAPCPCLTFLAACGTRTVMVLHPPYSCARDAAWPWLTSAFDEGFEETRFW